MEVVVTIAYYFFIRMIFVDFKWLKFNMFWQFIVFGIYLAAVLTEVVGLGQYTPYSETTYVQAYVIPMAPEYGGILKKVHVKSNVQVKKGDTLFQMDPSEFQYRVNEMEAKLSASGTNVSILSEQVAEARAEISISQAALKTAKMEYEQILKASKQNAVAQITVEQYAINVENSKAQLTRNQAALNSNLLAYESETSGQPTDIAEAIANLEKAKYNLTQTAILAPSNGYVTYLQIHPGSFIRMKQPIMTFVSTDEYWLLTQYTQFGVQHVEPGDICDIALRMYPGEIFSGQVEEIYWSSGNAQGEIGGRIPTENEIQPANTFMVRIKVNEKEGFPLRFGASGISAIYTKNAIDVVIFLRQLEIQSESFLNYIYNPFR
ncbi:HlyD family secretion protein [Formosa sp. PL04]|uniref:HlyD family secretion protein n=1 Tax=Formosa sp. PL04 TaxID=3081755 RepID=UPI0029818778|nr:efflux RND transporter periplasmic adaptor subunit [Formosa sp. PL04]MDW5287379.1 efflux RND transporter periplasmic adaptor subunit [Formosa sp. PL04]